MATNKEIIQDAYASFAQGDVPAVLAKLAPSIEWTEPAGYPLGGTYVGPQAIVDGVFMRLGEVGEDFSIGIDRIVADGDTVVALGTTSWKHTDTGAPAEVDMVHVWTLADGKATSFQMHIDTVMVRELS